MSALADPCLSDEPSAVASASLTLAVPCLATKVTCEVAEGLVACILLSGGAAAAVAAAASSAGGSNGAAWDRDRDRDRDREKAASSAGGSSSFHRDRSSSGGLGGGGISSRTGGGSSSSTLGPIPEQAAGGPGHHGHGLGGPWGPGALAGAAAASGSASASAIGFASGAASRAGWHALTPLAACVSRLASAGPGGAPHLAGRVCGQLAQVSCAPSIHRSPAAPNASSPSPLRRMAPRPPFVFLHPCLFFSSLSRKKGGRRRGLLLGRGRGQGGPPVRGGAQAGGRRPGRWGAWLPCGPPGGLGGAALARAAGVRAAGLAGRGDGAEGRPAGAIAIAIAFA